MSLGRQDRILRAVDASSEELVRFARDLVRAKSVTGDEETAQGVVQDKLAELGAEIDCWKPSQKDLKGYEAFTSEEKNIGDRPNVVGRFRGAERLRSLAFNGHIDVVPEGDRKHWKHPPYGADVLNGRLYGRGACDMKGGLAAAIFGVGALVRADVPLQKELLIESVMGEESGGVGTLATILRGYLPDAVIIAEPTNLELVTVQAGCLMFRLRLRGRAAHGASRYMGVSAVEKFQPVLTALLALEERRKNLKRHPLFKKVPNSVTLSIGTVHAGNWDSTVPEELTAEGRYGVRPGEELETAKRQFEKAVNKAAAGDSWLREHPPELIWYGPQWESSETPQGHWLPRLVDGAYHEALGGRPVRAGISGGTDMRLFTNLAKVPAVIFGPGDDSRAHFSDESVSVKDLVKACKVYALAALAWNG